MDRETLKRQPPEDNYADSSWPPVGNACDSDLIRTLDEREGPLIDIDILPARPDGKRMETGPVQFGDDWPGMFIRGDNAFGLVVALRQACTILNEQTPQTERSGPRVMVRMMLESYAESLNQCNLVENGEYIRTRRIAPPRHLVLITPRAALALAAMAVVAFAAGLLTGGG